MGGAVYRHIRRNVVGYIALFVALSGTAFAAGKIGSRDIKPNAVKSRHIKDGQVRRADLAGNSVDASKIIDGSVGSAELGTGSVGSSELAPGAVGAAALAPGAVGAPALAPNAVGSSAIADGAVAPADTGTVPAALVAGGGSTVADANNTSVNIPFDDSALQGAIDFDTDGMHSYTVNPERFTAHTPGIYEISAEVSWDTAASSAGHRRLDLGVDGLSIGISQVPGTTEAIEQSGTFLSHMAPGDIARLTVSQNSGGSVNVRGVYFAIHWIGP